MKIEVVIKELLKDLRSFLEVVLLVCFFDFKLYFFFEIM